MSFDEYGGTVCQEQSLNPFGTGQCLSTSMVGRFVKNRVSIPLEQGNVFRLKNHDEVRRINCLNPFGTGQCLSTYCVAVESSWIFIVSIPLEQGNVFRLVRLVDFDKLETVSIPLEQGNVFRLSGRL